jgi:uncharacterized phage protein gp47/JayE
MVLNPSRLPGTSIFAGYDTTLPRSIIDRQSDTNLRIQAMAHFTRLAPGMDTVEGSWAFDLIQPFCLIVAQAYFDLIDIERRTSLATATGLDLDRLGDLYGVLRAPAAFAEGEVTITGVAGTPIPEGTLTATGQREGTFVSTVGASPVQFRVTVPGEIPGVPPNQGSVIVPVRALTPGINGNVPAGRVSIFGAVPPVGLTSVTNALPMHGGTNTQPDGPVNQYVEGYRGDIWELANARGEGGAAKHLRKWARMVPGVGRVRVIETYPMPGWVTLVLLDTDGEPADADLVHAVEAFILDPWYIFNEAEDMDVTGSGATLSGNATPDATPLGAMDNAVIITGAGSVRQLLTEPGSRLLPQAGVWRLKPRTKVSTTTNAAPLFTMGVWNINADEWAWSRPSNLGTQSYLTVAANRLSATFIPPDIDPLEIDFTWNGYDRLELRIDMSGFDTTTELFIDQVNYFAIMSRDDRDVGRSPAGMRVNVIPAVPVDVDISATITYGLSRNQTLQMVNQAIAENIRAYFRSVIFGSENLIRRAAVEDAIFRTPGVADVNDVVLTTTSINLPPGAVNISFGITQVARVGTLTWATPGSRPAPGPGGAGTYGWMEGRTYAALEAFTYEQLEGGAQGQGSTTGTLEGGSP